MASFYLYLYSVFSFQLRWFVGWDISYSYWFAHNWLKKRHEGSFPAKKLNVRPEEEITDVDSLAQQFAGRKFGELVLEHHKKNDFPKIVAALQGTIEELPQNARPSVESWIDEIAPYGKDPSFWQRDCGEVFLEICDLTRQYVQKRRHPLISTPLIRVS